MSTTQFENGIYKIDYIHGKDGEHESVSKVVFRLKDGEIFPLFVENEILSEEQVLNDLDYKLILKNLKP